MDQKTKHFVGLQEYMEPKSKRQTTYSIKIQIQALNNTRQKIIKKKKKIILVVVQESTQIMEGEELKGLKREREREREREALILAKDEG